MPSKETYECGGDWQDDDPGYFATSDGSEQFIYTMPDEAKLDVEQVMAKYLLEEGATFCVIQNPATMQDIRDRLDIQPIFNFPPAGGNIFYADGHTVPPNLRELIRDRVAQGWTITPLLQTLLDDRLIEGTVVS